MLKDALGGYRGTAEEITRIISRYPENAEAWYNRANARSRTGDFRGAEVDYTMALKLGLRFREAVTAYGNRAIARAELGEIDGAIEDCSAIIDRRPNNKRLLYAAFMQRALLKEKKGDSEGAAGDRKIAALVCPRI
ncbi:MAG: tetratricopeptide repeat protein [Chlorobium sp.]|uniref:tetratricopeptide repeat protein n=1 Tax=Chlorobium sp. TaxID=1095 RepID=UPI0025BA9BE7|nr:tetratricopeptide repeat protein [Chlorobium sp.]MCF8383055.1 tetratricopeptide repeat protein [Chlorobium sp.]